MTEKAKSIGQAATGKIRTMFSEISVRYDLLNRVMSLGRDIFWRHCLSRRLLILKTPGIFLDLATGTGDQILSIKKFYPKAKVTGLDFADPMLKLAKKKLDSAAKDNKISEPLPTLVYGDALRPDLPLASFDSVSISFGLRNIANKKALYQSVLSLLRPGGRFLVLEVFFDPRSFLAPIYLWHLQSAIPFLARNVFQSSFDAYRYLGQSILKFPHPDRLLDSLKQAGFVDLGYRTYTFGAVMVVWGHKPL
jgi:demethylmenaquinone methyltransferase/2-methoxy-6-polyprenyl-1,4-benzoquinol methylase